MDVNYFVCTLGQAAALKGESKPWRTIGEFLRYQSEHNGHIPAVGFPIPKSHSNSWTYRIFTFEEIERGARTVASRLLEASGAAVKCPQTIALLADSSPEFLFTWLALIVLGHSVLLIAPQCQTQAVVHLCKECKVRLLLHDDSHHTLAASAEAAFKDLTVLQLPFHVDERLFENDQSKTKREPGSSTPFSDDTAVAYLHHTSGTSSGLPKPIPQTHRGAIGVLPHLPNNKKSTFTTTPLYHGGIADLFRAWASDSLIWLFPGHGIPITARNVCLCLDAANNCTAMKRTSPVGYFSSVPYVLQMMEGDEVGLNRLKSMDIVGVGGAALPIEIGDRLVSNGVNLISRFGSAECGFLLSSYRDFAKDKDWQYLRNANPKELLSFVPQEGDLFELVVRPGWPHMAKKNRPDGSFATADLFAPHPTVECAWIYHSRADAQLTLITGKKFDPAPLEAAIATSHLLDDVLIFGNGRAFPGALLLRSKESGSLSDNDLLECLKPHINRLNKESQAHAQIPYNMLVSLPHQRQGLEKSSKGTIIRKAAEERFRQDIEAAYDKLESTNQVTVADEDLPKYLAGMVQSITSSESPPNPTKDLFSYGIDSVASMQLRSRLRSLIPKSSDNLPLSIVEDCGSIERMCQYIINKRRGAAGTETEDEESLMQSLVQEYSNFTFGNIDENDRRRHEKHNTKTGQVVLLTGATGALGAHILGLLRAKDDISHIYCLVRGADSHAATERVNKALEQRGLKVLDANVTKTKKVIILCAQLCKSDLGLPQKVYKELVAEVDLIVHVAWTVNFRIRLRSFAKDNIGGLRNLIELALRHPGTPPRFLYCSSTAAVLNQKPDQTREIPEQILSDPKTASPLGYSRSKWVAEQICFNAHAHTKLKDHIAVVRVGQLSGDSDRGIWNTQEAWPMMLSTAKLTGSLPDLPQQPLDWLPVDIAAQALIEAAGGIDKRKQMHVFHVLNEHRHPTWTDMLHWLKKKEEFEVLPPSQWVERLEQYEGTHHPALKLLGLWKQAYCGKANEEPQRPKFSLAASKACIPILRDVKSIDEVYMLKIWQWIQESVS
ncbi:hypothetical protein BU24DRAFT_391156 [Aaosphaeria arxii CBS 175.79]|uniref:Carrier domain-containing protein n=1 Tax=Aaosphaeria arxii CBS 175.79 TaxID=1450172 RepID=A0A6A5XSE6_9PLEO|nr:uncharacterized protein BU24DRAFT_391156 [Aaosphaeria arxii CBS 175.79]KAF2015863.1 hypothetical protein BU24DRAFT_391156 [Aaosphaeria arxii CBS 175.79]